MLAACTHIRAPEPCDDAKRTRAAGFHPIERKTRATNGKAIIFLQGLPRETAPELFWPEDVAGDHLFRDYDVYTFAFRDEGSCANESRAAELAKSVNRTVDSYSIVDFVAQDVRHAALIRDLVSTLPAEARTRIRRTFVFHTPERDDLVAAEGRKCTARSIDARPMTIICSTFDRATLAAAPHAKVCDSILGASLPVELRAMPRCANPLYLIFRDGLYGTLYESENVIPLWRPPSSQ
ncbi:MAG TPA: hypothetical protein VHW00_05145 [Thermoanaerobaculia bacterium]|nr:hypothetical protein [Thermoanaerobaculia bacterium]